MKKIFSLLAMCGAFSAFAGTYTWTGAAGDGLYFTAGNWNYDGAPAENSPGNAPADDIVIDGDYVVTYVPGGDWVPTGTITVTGGATFTQNGGAWPNIMGTIIVDNGTVDYVNNASNPTQTRVPGSIVLRNGGQFLSANVTSNPSMTIGQDCLYSHSDTMSASVAARYTLDGGTLEVGNEFQPADGSVFSGAGTISCSVFSPQTAGSVITFEKANLILRSANYNGFYQAGGTYIDIPSTSTSRFTVQTATKTESAVYAITFGSNATTPKFRYNGEVISLEQFVSLFTVEEHADAIDGSSDYADFYLTANAAGGESMNFASSSIAMGTADDKVVVNAAFENLDEGSVLKLAYSATGDMGRKLASWGDNVINVGAATEEGVSNAIVSGLPAGQTLTMRLFLVSSNGEVPSGAVSFFTRYYGVSGIVNEWIGAVSTSLADAGNWTLGHAPTDDEIRWFGTNAVNDVVISGSFGARATDVFKGGKIIASSELHFVNGQILGGTAFEAGIIAPQVAGTEIIARSGSVLLSNTGNGAFWAPGASFVNVTAGSTARFTFPFAASEIYSRTFGTSSATPKFKYGSGYITATQFAELFEVEEYIFEGEEPVTGCTFYLKPVSEAAPVFGDDGVTSSREAGSLDVTFTAAIQSAGSPAATVTVFYGLSDGGIDAEAWDGFVSLGEAVSNDSLSETVTLVANRKYYFAARASNENGTVWVAGTPFLTAEVPAAPYNTWLGKVSSDSGTSANWSLGHVPTVTEKVAVIDVFAENDLEWFPTTASTVAGWEHFSYNSGVVFVNFHTTKDAGLTITGDVSLDGANWTHEGPAESPVNCVNVTVGGNLTVGANSTIQAGTAQENNSKFRARGYTKGPGYKELLVSTPDEEGGTNIETTVYFGGSFAGDGGHRPFDGSFVSYGSILNPMEWGSAGKGDSVDNYAGAGLIVLKVGGTLTVNGKIESHGFGWDAQRAGASGGSINITTARIAGSGSINADGGRCLNGPGSGGRIRVKLTDEAATFEDFGAPTKIHANPGNFTNLTGESLSNDVVLGSAGTVVLQLASDAENAGDVIVSDDNELRRNALDETSIVSATHLPARQNASENLKSSRWELQNHGKIRVTADVKVAALSITDTEKQKVILESHTLTVTKLKVGERNLKGNFTVAQVNATIGSAVFAGEGNVVCGMQGFSIVIR